MRRRWARDRMARRTGSATAVRAAAGGGGCGEAHAFPAVAGFRADDRRADRPGAVCRRAEGRMSGSARTVFRMRRDRCGGRAMIAQRRGSASRISASARSTAATRPNTPRTRSKQARTTAPRSASTSGRPRSQDSCAAGRALHTAARRRRQGRSARDRLDQARAGRDREPEKAVRPPRRPGIDVISMTVTEKGYCHMPASGVLDWHRAEIVDDLKRAAGRQSLPGFLVEMLGRRMAGNAPVTLIIATTSPATDIS